MTVLSGQTIRRRGIFTPFCERTREYYSGMTYGLGPAGYDVRCAEELKFDAPWAIDRIGYSLGRRAFRLASTVEHFEMPTDCLGRVHDKSTLARLGLHVQNTIVEPGWRGHLTLEISFQGAPDGAEHILLDSSGLYIPAGTPIAQIVLELLDEPAESPYAGRYQDQASGVVHAKELRGGEATI